ncbi:hypothetical protein EDB81DRAFT_788487 [Dactylonectria macrodidyma]|uniref:Uncharacterized protein n=1 Tax=Dactylonectria macrodidyma TaxID=307937 RepID=A0A9P9F7S2_9HYPO|nr:hypothetical protein EDB81DRAFT_788487 [Dactylonectria macrodidyma]
MPSAPFHADRTLPTLSMHHRPQPVPPHGVRGSPARACFCYCACLLPRSRHLGPANQDLSTRIRHVAQYRNSERTRSTSGDGCVGAWDVALPFRFSIQLRILCQITKSFLGLMASSGQPNVPSSTLSRNRLLSSDPAPFLPPSLSPTPWSSHPLNTICVTTSTWALNESPSLGSRRVNQNRVQASSENPEVFDCLAAVTSAIASPVFILTGPFVVSTTLDSRFIPKTRPSRARILPQGTPSCKRDLY